MMFNSFAFLFGFLPVTLILYYLIQNRTAKNALLVLASLVLRLGQAGIHDTAGIHDRK